MANDKTGGPAFPLDGPQGAIHNGMTLRDYFAAKAMQGLLAGLDRDARRFMESQKEPVASMAVAAYVMADAMLKARNV